MSLDDLVINESSRSLINSTLANMPQALLLHGKPGTGLGTIAKAMAEKSGTLLETVYPKKRQTNGTYAVDLDNGTIVIEDIRALYERTRSKFTSPQIVIIDFSGRTMSPGAQNAFLKLLEEPQRYVHFILAVHDLTHVLPTITSRCQRIDITPASAEQTTALLKKLGVTDDTKRTRIAFIASGLPAEITKLATDQAYYDARVQTVQDARAILAGDSYTRLTIIQTYRDKRSAALQLIDDMSRQLELALQKSPAPALAMQLDTFIDAYERIRGNGNIALTLAKVLL